MTTTAQAELSAAEARRLVVAAQFGPVLLPDARAVLQHLGLLQLDPLRRVAPAHQLTTLARMPSAHAASIDEALWAQGLAVAYETWVHAACLVPVEDWPLLALARARALRHPHRPPPPVCAAVLDLVARSPSGVTITDIEAGGPGTKGWDWSPAKSAAEHLVRSGELVCTTRRDGKRVYDLPRRRIPAAVLDTRLEEDEILGELVRRAVTVMGVATTADIATYYNLTAPQVRAGLQVCQPAAVKVECWTELAWTYSSTLPPDPTREPALIGPFDNLIWDRKRTRRAFGFDYAFEAYKPAAKRRYGYYVLALLDGDTFTGRADLQRVDGQVRILAAHPEPTTDTRHFDHQLTRAVDRLAAQLLPLSPTFRS